MEEGLSDIIIDSHPKVFFCDLQCADFVIFRAEEYQGDDLDDSQDIPAIKFSRKAARAGGLDIADTMLVWKLVW